MKPAVESQRAWDLLVGYWNSRDKVTEENRCQVVIRNLDDRANEQCVLDKSHLDGETLGANVPHADADGNIAPLSVSWETIRDAKYFREHPLEG